MVEIPIIRLSLYGDNLYGDDGVSSKLGVLYGDILYGDDGASSKLGGIYFL